MVGRGILMALVAFSLVSLGSQASIPAENESVTNQDEATVEEAEGHVEVEDEADLDSKQSSEESVDVEMISAYLNDDDPSNDEVDGSSDDGAAGGYSHSRARRSADYYQQFLKPSKHLEENSYHYRERNQIRSRLENHLYYPLHYGHIYTGDVGDEYDYDIKDRPFGHDADFNFPYDAHAFKYKPKGPRLTESWKKHGYPIYSHNLYKLRDKIKVFVFNKQGKANMVTLKGGVYRFVSVNKKGSVLFENVKTKERYLSPDLFSDVKKSKKFQALGPWKDPNGLYFPVSAPALGGDAYIIKGTPLTGHDPSHGNNLVYHGFSYGLKAPPGSLLDRDKGKKKPNLKYDHRH